MKLYVVRNKQGKFFRAVGQGGYRKIWEDSLDNAKFYAKLGQAKSRVTYFFKSGPSYGCPDILEFELDIQKAKVLDMTESTTKSIQKIRKKEIDRELY